MPFTKVWYGNTSGQEGVWAHHANWRPISIRNATYRWLASGSGTSNYYLDLAGGGDPSIPAAPGAVLAAGVALVAGTLGALTAGQFAYGDSDTLGYSTIYVRLTDSTDPDTKVNDYLTFTAVPATGEHISIPIGSANITGVDVSATTYGNVRVEDSTAVQAGSATAYLRLTCAGFYFGGAGTCYIDLAASAIAPDIRNTATANEGLRGLYLKGTAITTLKLVKGAVGFASLPGESGRLDAFHVLPNTGQTASLWLGGAVTNVVGSGKPDGELRDGATVVSRSDVDDVTMYGGDYTQKEGTWEGMTAYAGTVKPEGAGTYVATVLAGAVLTTETSPNTKTLTDLTVRKGSTVKDPASRITFTNAIIFPDGIGVGPAAVTLDFGANRKFTPIAA